MQLDSSSDDFVKLSKKFSVSLPFYVAGVAESVKLPAGAARIGFRGCIANVTFNERSISLLTEHSVQGVGVCHLNVETAAYFEGNGYAVQSTTRTNFVIDESSNQLLFRINNNNYFLLQLGTF